MDKKSLPKAGQLMAGKIFFLVFFLLIAGSVAATYYRIMIKRDYIISAQQECDPTSEACFVSACDPESDEECAALPEKERINYYKTINKNAKNIPVCDPYKNECPKELSCDPGEGECEITLCDANNVPEGEECNDPLKYLEENPSNSSENSCGEEGDAGDSAEENIESAEIDLSFNPEPDKGEEGDGVCGGSLPDEENADNSKLNNKSGENAAPQLY